MKICTLNLNCHNTWNSKKALLVPKLKDLACDVYSFQEISAKEEDGVILNEALEISKALDVTGYFSASYKCSPNQGNFYKPSNFDSVESYHFSFSGILDSGKTDKHRRLFLANKFSKDSKSFYLINLHFSIDKDFRFENIRQLNIWLKANTTEKDNIFVVGDFNNYDQSSSKGDIEQALLELGFKDAWKTLRKDPCVTYYGTDWWKQNYPNSSYTKSIEESGDNYPDIALDYLFYKGSSIKLKDIDYINLVPDVTDHVGLILDFDL